VINDKPIYGGDFNLARKYKPRTPLLVFSKTPQGAYLTEQDKTYLERIQKQLEEKVPEKRRQ
jgi:hypothetical protein